MIRVRSGRHVILVLQGGIGNQLFQLCAGESIRRKTAYPVSYDCDLAFRHDPFGRRFELVHLIPPEQRAPPHPGTGVWRTSLQERLAATVEKRLMWRQGISSLPLEPTLRMVRWWPGSEVVCRSCFQLLEYLDTETVDRIRSAVQVRPDGPSSDVAVHFRLTRDRNRAGEQVRDHSGTMVGGEYYREALKQIRAELGPVRFRVFSDSGAIPENVFEPCDRVALDAPLQNETPWDILCRMAGCGHFVIANSTFSWWAAYLSRTAGKRVYAPKTWWFHGGAPAQKGIFPDEWRRV